MEITRERTMELLREHNRDENHIKHALAVEATMRHFARKFGEDEELWGITGLIHDLDWGKTQDNPEKHCHLAPEWLREAGYPDEIIRALQSHGWGICTDVEPKTLMEKTIFAIDELTGFIVAVALVRPSRSLQDMAVKSVKKKWKDKRFAAGVDRSVVEKGSEMLDMPLEELISETLEAMKPVEKEIGLGE
ncbi:MAG: HDIG domain-containing protein [Synergistales bacterium]|nr:HDIG domain-containing protein [Synergistales bacterium]